MKKIVAVDLDDVLAKEAEYVINYSNKNWGHSLSLEDYTEQWGDMWGVDYDEVERRAEELNKPEVVRDYLLIEQAHEALQKLSKKYKLIIITSRRFEVKEETHRWLQQNFGNLFEEVHFSGIWDGRKVDAHLLTKKDLCIELDVSYLIDDQPKHCRGAVEAGVKAVLFGDYAQTRDLKLPNSMIRAKNWQEVLEYFKNEKDNRG